MKRNGGELVEMHVFDVTVDPASRLPVVVLRDDTGETLSLWIGLSEAQSIAVHVERVALERPVAHDLLKNLAAAAGLTVDRIVLREVKDETFYASIFLARSGDSAQKPVELDARPSDAIALALRAGARILVARHVLDEARDLGPGLALATSGNGDDAIPCGGEADGTEADGPSILHLLADEDFGKWKM